MEPKKQEIWAVNQLLFFFMSFGILMVIAKWASELVVPLLISTMIALLLQPVMKRLERRGFPRPLALALVILIMVLLLTLFGIFIVTEINDFVAHTAVFKEKLQHLVDQLFHFLHNLGIPHKERELEPIFQPEGLVALFRQTLVQLGNQFSNTLLILFSASFLIMDSLDFRSKLHRILQSNPERLAAVEEVLGKMHTYFNIMARVSLITGVSALLLLWFFDVDYALLWAALTFFLNFIPVIGSIIAAVPPVILALVEHSWSVALWIALGYLIINNVVGNILQPTMMGRGLGLSSFTVFWSMIFWGWFFGPTGMILSVPLTMGVQFLLLQYDETRWLGFLLSDYGVKDIPAEPGENDDPSKEPS
jgi:predicted PurR-regulated permease PerM